MGHIFHEVEHVAVEASHFIGGPIGEIGNIVSEGTSAVEDFKHHHDIQGVVAGVRAVSSILDIL